MKNLLFVFAILLAFNGEAYAQNNTKKKEDKAEKTQWVIKGAKVFNSKSTAQTKQNQAKTTQTRQPQVRQLQARQVESQQVQPRSVNRPTARIISSESNNNYRENSYNSNSNVQSYNNYNNYNNNNSYGSYPVEMKSMAVVEAQEFMSKGSNNALVVEIEGANAKMAKKVWADFMKENYSTRVKKVKKEQDYLAEGVNIGIVGNGGGVNLYSRAEDRGSAAKFMVWMDVGNDYLSSGSYPTWYTTAESMMYEYKLEVKREVVREELAAEEKNLKKIQSLLNKLKRDNERYHKTIEEAHKRIQKAESDIATNEAEQLSTLNHIEEQMKVIQQVTNKLNSIK